MFEEISYPYITLISNPIIVFVHNIIIVQLMLSKRQTGNVLGHTEYFTEGPEEIVQREDIVRDLGECWW